MHFYQANGRVFCFQMCIEEEKKVQPFDMMFHQPNICVHNENNINNNIIQSGSSLCEKSHPVQRRSRKYSLTRGHPLKKGS